MVPETGKYYVIQTQWGQNTPWASEESCLCYGPDGIPAVNAANGGRNPDGLYRFGAALPHEEDAGRGVQFIVHERDVLREAR